MNKENNNKIQNAKMAFSSYPSFSVLLKRILCVSLTKNNQIHIKHQLTVAQSYFWHFVLFKYMTLR